MIKQITALVRRLWSIQILRFFMVGGLNTIFGYGVFAAFILLHLHYVLAALLSQMCGVLFNFQTTGTLAFRNKDNRLIFRFLGVYLMTYFLNIALLKAFDLSGVGSLIAGAIIALPVASAAFWLNKQFVFEAFKKKRQIDRVTEKP